MSLFRSQDEEKALLRIASSLERLEKLYSLDLSAKGLTLYTEEGEGEILETSDALIFELERKEDVRKLLGLAPSYPVGGALPTPGVLRDSPSPAQEEEGPAPEEPAHDPRRFDPYSGSSWGNGPEGSEDPFHGA